MIRLAEASGFISLSGSEAAIRIACLAAAYGQAPFLQLYTDTESANRLALMDGVAFFHAPAGVTADWRAFLCMLPEIAVLRTDADTGIAVGRLWGQTARTGLTMRYIGHSTESTAQSGLVMPEKLYALLRGCFSDLPPFASWYVDVSHRVRHGLCHIVTLTEQGKPVSCAMTLAETPAQVLLGAVCTEPAYRGRGLAQRCLLSLLQQFPAHECYLSPASESLQAYYARLGFVPAGTWAIIHRR